MKEFQKKIFKKEQYISIASSNFLGDLYLIINGKATKNFAGKNYDLQKGQFINLISSLAKKSQITTVKALTDLEVIIIPVKKLSEVLKYESIAYNMFQETSFYLKETFKIGHNLLKKEQKVKKNAEKHEISCFNFGKYLFDQNLYDRAEYIFKKTLDYYPDINFKDEINDFYLNKIKAIKNNNLEKPYPKGKTIYSQFERDNRLIFLNKGEVKFLFYTEGNEYHIETLKAKTIFGQMSFHSKVRDLSCISNSDETEILFIEYNTFEKFIRNQNIKTLTNVITQFARRTWKAAMILEHVKAFREHENVYHQVCDVLYTLYEAEIQDEKVENKGTFNYTITIGELFQSSNFPPNFDLEELNYIIEKSSFLSLTQDKKIVCEDISFLYNSCYKSRRQKEKMRYERK